MLDVLLKQKGISLYQLEKKSGLSHSTLNDLYHERIDINKCSVITLKKIADVLNMSLDRLYKFLNYDDLSCFVVDKEFDLFKSDVCHEVKRLTPEKFVKKYLSNNEIEMLYKNKEYVNSIYLISMIEHLCKELNIPMNKDYKQIKEHKLKKISLPAGIMFLLKRKKIKFNNVIKDSINTFYKNNIIEGDVLNVC